MKRKKSKEQKKYVRKGKIMFENYTDSLFSNKIVLKIHQRFKNDHIMYTLKILI